MIFLEELAPGHISTQIVPCSQDSKLSLRCRLPMSLYTLSMNSLFWRSNTDLVASCIWVLLVGHMLEMEK